jgi:hypothetical protein
MRTAVLIALIVSLAGCSTTGPAPHPYAMPNSLMRREIQSRISNFDFLHGQDLLNTMLWLQTKAGETAIVDLLGVLDHASPKVRCSAIWILGRIRDRRVIPDLRPLVSDKHAVVRLEAARSLVALGDLKYVTILIEGLDSDKPAVRYNCHMALKDNTKKDFGYDHLEDDDTLRRTTVLKWREWWARQSSDPWFAASYAREHGLPSASLDQVSALPTGETKTPAKTPAKTTAKTPTKRPDTGSVTNPWAPIEPTPDPTKPKGTGAETKTPGKTGENTKDDTPVFKLLDLGPAEKKPTTNPDTAAPGKTTTDKTTPEKAAPGKPTPGKSTPGKTGTDTATPAKQTEKTEKTEKTAPGSSTAGKR